MRILPPPTTTEGGAMKRLLRSCIAGAVIAASLSTTAHAHPGPSDASAVSMLPIALSVTAPAILLSGGAVLTVVAVEAASDGTIWLLERSADGARASVRLSATAAGGLSVAAGTVVLVSAISTGWVLSAAGRAIAYIPNEIGQALLHNERLTR
jgi:hypothetical protein